MNLEDLGRRAVACKHWRWMPGMLAHRGGRMYRLIVCDGGTEQFVAARHEEDETVSQAAPKGIDLFPEFSDPATLGCLLHLVREAWPDEWHEFMVPIFDGFSHWRVGCLDLQRLPGAPQLIVPINQETMKPLVWAYSEAEALVAALEAAP